MPFYSTFILTPTASSGLPALFKQLHELISKSGGVLSVNDLGNRHFGYMVRKPQVGQFSHGRWINFRFAGNPRLPGEITEVCRNNKDVLRFLTVKESIKDFVREERHTFFKTPKEYEQETKELRELKPTYSI
jgi:ribosomal protein S6